MKINPQNKQLRKFVSITTFLIIVLIQTVQAQSVYVGQTGAKGKTLKKYIKPEELKKLIDHPVDSIWIIDVRPEKAFVNGHIPTARNFPSGSIMNRLNEIPKKNYLILYCTVGGLAKITANQLKKAGYNRYMIWGGISRWEWARSTGIQHDSIPSTPEK
ncbi:MAG: rhodanese-like domain-containing protein [Prolixibacteraceae bacterium]